MSIRKFQWGTSVEVCKLPSKDPPNEQQTKNVVNFSMLYFNKKPEINEKDIPETIIVKYSDDYNILELDVIIRRRLELIKRRDLNELKKKLDEENINMAQIQTGIERKQSLKNKINYLKRIEDLEADIDLHNYNRQSEFLIKKYKQIGVKKKIINFGNNENKVINENDNYRLKIITKYLEIARHYIQIIISKENTPNAYCNGCKNKLPEFVDETGIQRCLYCGTEKVYLNRSTMNTDNETQSSINHNDYDDRETFYKSLLRFQGKQTNRIPKRLWSLLDNYFNNLGIPTGEVIKKLTPNPDGSKQGTSRAMMMKALHELGFVDCYEDINLVCNIYWGWVLPDITHLEDIIMEHYDITQKVFEKIKKGKQSSLNAEYRLFKHLELVGYSCKEDDFKIIKTRDTLENCENKWRQMCEGAGLKFIPTI
jgi:hypothetical protein